MREWWEFFAGGGMASAGLGHGWRCTLANDFSPMKAACYRTNWGGGHLVEGDIGSLDAASLPGSPTLAWASTPCQDLSLAGDGAGLGAPEAPSTRSGAFWPWWKLMLAAAKAGKRPPIIAFENVTGALTSNKGADFEVVVRAFASAGYRVGAFVADARLFLPQSRPRLFVVAFDADRAIPQQLSSLGPQEPWHTAAVQTAHDRLPEDLRAAWVWWAMPLPMARRRTLAQLCEAEPTGVDWNPDAHTRRMLREMSPANRAKVEQARALGRTAVGTLYRRTRPTGSGGRAAVWEIRFDGVAGCLRTPSGGSSRQTIMVVEGESVRTRLLSPRECARLMGLPDSYRLPAAYNDAYHVCGDGVAVPVVRHVAAFLIEPLADAAAVAAAAPGELAAA
jgi:DNA (cytosine-5)-methyltransferase 1